MKLLNPFFARTNSHVGCVSTHQRKRRLNLWPLTLVIVAFLAFNAWGQRAEMPTNFQYKTVGFKSTWGDDMARLETAFSEMLNQEAATGWDYAGRCGHIDGEDYWVDYVVFKRRRH